MTKKLQTLLTLLLLFVGVTGAWAKIVWPTKTILYQTNDAPSSATAWSEGFPQDVLSEATIDIKEDDKRWAIVEFQIPRYSQVSSIKISTYYSNKDVLSDVNVYAFPYDMPGASDSWQSTFCENVNSAINSTALATISKPSGAAVSTGSITTTNLSTTFESFISDDVLTLRLVLWSEDRAIISSTGNVVPNRRLFLNVSYSDIEHPIYIGETAYDDLATAAKAASDDDVLLLYDDCFLTSRLLFKSGDGNVNNSVTFKAAPNNDVTIYRWSDFNDITFLCNYDKTITFDGSNSGASLTIDACNSAKADKVFFGNESSSGGTFSLKNVTVKNYNSTGPAVMQVNSGKTGSYVLENVTFEKCSPSTAIINSLTNYSEKIVLKGDLTFTNCTGTQISLVKHMKEDSFNPTSAITLAWSGTKADNTVVVSNANESNLSKYLLSDGWQLFYDNGSMKMKYDPEALVGETYYSRLADAISAETTTDGSTVKILKDCTVSSPITFTKNVTIIPNTTGITVNRSTTFGNNIMFVLATSGKTVAIGDVEKAMTIDGQSTSSTTQLIDVTNGTMSFTNMTIKNAWTSGNRGIIFAKGGIVKLTDVDFNACKATHATVKGILMCSANDNIVLSGNNTFTNCTGYDMYLENRFKIDETYGVTHTTPIKVYNAKISVGSPIATKVAKEEIPLFKLMNEGCYLKWRTESQTGDRRDMQVAEDNSTSYNLTVSAAGAATLVLPYTTTIPSSPSTPRCYTLSYTSGNDITATEITTTLPAHTPVLVMAAAGNYTFNKTTAQDPSSNDNLLMENYAANFVVPATTGDNTNYILSYKDSKLGFRKVDGSTNKVQPYRAYMSVKYVAGSGSARDFFGINFGGETTGIANLNVNNNSNFDTNAPMYNLAGQRVGSNYKGVVIQNGKKYIKK